MRIELPYTNGFLPDELMVRDDALLVYLCSGCDLDYDRPVIYASDTYDPVALRAHEGILRDHARFYGHTIFVFDTLINSIIGTIPSSTRLS